jgi:3-oxoacyl-[acyl-carrier protein] reductase
MSEEARYPELEKQSIIVTGGTRGIGLGIVRVLARAGVRLTVTGRKQERLDAVAAELSDLGAPHVVMQANQAEPEAATAVVERALESFGQVDGLVANAQSYLPVKPLLEIDSRDFDYVLDTGPEGSLWLMQAVHPHRATGPIRPRRRRCARSREPRRGSGAATASR